MFFFIGLIGGCAGSTCCSVKIFRYQIVVIAIANQIKRIHSPHGVFQPKYEGRTLTEDVVSSVMAFLTLFVVTMGILAVLLSATGLDFVTSVSGAATAIANVGPGLARLGFAPERLAKLMQRQARDLAARDEAAAHRG